MKEAGYDNIWTPYAELYHKESVSRGQDTMLEEQDRFMRERAYMHRKWSRLLNNDPAYNPNLSSNPFFSLSDPPRAKRPWKNDNDD